MTNIIKNAFTKFANYLQAVDQLNKDLSLKAQLAEIRQLQSIQHKEYVWGKGITTLAILMLHAFWFITYQAISFTCTMLYWGALVPIITPVAYMVYDISLLQAVTFLSYSSYKGSITEVVKFAYSVGVEYFKLLFARDNQLGLIEENAEIALLTLQPHSWSSRARIFTFKLTDSILTAPARLINALNNKIINFALTQKNSAKIQVLSVAYNAYSYVMQGILLCLGFIVLTAPMIILLFIMDHKPAQVENGEQNIPITKISEIPTKTLAIVHLPLNIIFGISASLFAMLEVYFSQQRTNFNKKVFAPPNIFEKFEKAIINAINTERFAEILQLYNGNQVMHTWPELFYKLDAANNKYFSGIASDQMTLLENDDDIPKCLISLSICHIPVYTETSNGHRQYYDLAHALRWLSLGNRQDTPVMPKSIAALKYDPTVKARIESKIEAARNASVQERAAQPEPEINNTNACLNYFREIYCRVTGSQRTTATPYQAQSHALHYKAA